jgi:hypothetical protein
MWEIIFTDGPSSLVSCKPNVNIPYYAIRLIQVSHSRKLNSGKNMITAKGGNDG